ncbi:MAG: outer membrane beta-barrel protein [Ignavibacteriales bacterium]|nr:outer membrane beta-barrel protein [Ignavibacteriales bacterium]
MVRYYFFVIIIFGGVVLPQSKVSLSAMGGFNYIPLKNFSHYLNSFENPQLDKYSFSGNVKINYSFNSQHHIYIGGEYISTNASFSGGFGSVIWTFEAIPVTVGYEYSIKSDNQGWVPYVGAGISYVFGNTEDTYLGDDGSMIENYADNSFGFEIKIGVDKDIVENLFLSSEIKYRYIGDGNIGKYSVVEKNLSGVSFLAGVKLAIF